MKYIFIFILCGYIFSCKSQSHIPIFKVIINEDVKEDDCYLDSLFYEISISQFIACDYYQRSIEGRSQSTFLKKIDNSIGTKLLDNVKVIYYSELRQIGSDEYDCFKIEEWIFNTESAANSAFCRLNKLGNEKLNYIQPINWVFVHSKNRIFHLSAYLKTIQDSDYQNLINFINNNYFIRSESETIFVSQ